MNASWSIKCYWKMQLNALNNLMNNIFCKLIESKGFKKFWSEFFIAASSDCVQKEKTKLVRVSMTHVTSSMSFEILLQEAINKLMTSSKMTFLILKNSTICMWKVLFPTKICLFGTWKMDGNRSVHFSVNPFPRDRFHMKTKLVILNGFEIMVTNTKWLALPTEISQKTLHCFYWKVLSGFIFYSPAIKDSVPVTFVTK